MNGAAVTEPATTPDLIAAHGLSETEYRRAQEILGRDPNLTELGIFSVMWSEHCSYKSSKKWLKTLPTEAPWVICGPGENAGVIDIGDGQAAVFKMESHNHPSFIEPYQGAATGVGGILRDVFTMGARPVASLNCLRFGHPDHPRTRHLVAGVVAGIGGYGNCVGVPTVGGECTFHESYNGNILVNAMTVGLADADRIFYSTAAGAGNPLVYVGSKTGRDGIHGATMASAEFDEAAEERRPTVQVGDPFTEKLLLEACLELMATDAIVAIQDMGAAGLTSSSFEMAGKGGMGVELDLDHVPQRETGMSPYEIMLSESQERMLMVLQRGREEEARRIFEKWELDFAVVGQLTDTGRMVVRMNGEVAVDLPIAPLANTSPEYDRPWAAAAPPEQVLADSTNAPETKGFEDVMDVLQRLLVSPDLASKRWVWDQYDHLVMGRTVQRPGGDAAVVRVPGSRKALALSADCTPRYCAAFPRTGGSQAVAESWRNLTAAGARPLAITDCMNFGSPERPEIMGQFVECIEGMRKACLALDFPVVFGQRELLQRNQRCGDPTDPRDRRRRYHRRHRIHGDHRAQRGWKCARPHRASAAATSVPPCICGRSPDGRMAHRPQSISKRNAETATSFACRSPTDASFPAMTSRTAGCSSRSPKWPWLPPRRRGTCSEPCSTSRTACPCMRWPSGRIRDATFSRSTRTRWTR